MQVFSTKISRILRNIGLTGLMSLSLSSICSAATYYVAPTGNDSGSGSQSSPFRQIRAAISRVHPGDNVLVSDGSYSGFDIKNIAGSNIAPIAIQALGASCVVTPTTDRPDNRDTIFISNSSNIVLYGLTSFNANRAAIRIDHSQYITVKNGKYGNNTEWGIFTDFSDNLLLESNECYGSGIQHGIYVSNGCVNPIVRGNLLHDNHGSGLHMNGDASQGGSGIITNALVENNTIYGNSVAGGGGINMDGVQNSTIRNNLIYGNHATGISSYRIDASAGPSGNLYANNTIDVPAGARWALLITNTSGMNTVRNNILINHDSFRGGLDYGSTADANNVDSDYNILDKITTDDGTTVYSLAQWKAKGHEAHSLSATPSALWVNSGSANYHLLSTAPAINAGQIISSILTDLDGNPRQVGGSMDIGCYEYQGIQSAVLSSLSISPASVSGGSLSQGTVTLSSAASVGGISVNLSSSSINAMIPAFVNVPAGAVSAAFTITTNSVSADSTAVISAVLAGVTKTANLTIQANSGSFVLGIAIGGSAVTIDGNSWLNYANALKAGLTVSNANPANTNPVTYVPAPDSNVASMLSRVLWRSAPSNGIGFKLKQPLSNGSYQVYLWEVEDDGDHARNMNILLQGVNVASGIGDQLLGHWSKYGPYNATVTNGSLSIQIVRGTKGNPQISGISIFKK